MEAEPSELAAKARWGPPAALLPGAPRGGDGRQIQGAAGRKFPMSGRLTGTCPKEQVANRARPDHTIPIQLPVRNISPQTRALAAVWQLVTYQVNLSTL
jgi:hypothetical protein